MPKQVTIRVPLHISQHYRCRAAISDDMRDYKIDICQTFGCKLQLISGEIEAKGIEKSNFLSSLQEGER